MSILTDREIKENHQLLSPLKEEQLNPHGYDLAVESVCINNDLYDKGEWFDISIPPKTFFIVNTLETVDLLETNVPLVAKMWIKTSFARKGIILSDGLIDCGFRGTLNLCCYNASDSFITLKKGQPFCQIVFEVVNSPDEEYAERSGNYQNQKTIMFEGGKQ